MGQVFWVFTIDGDWDEYFRIKLPEARRRPDTARLEQLVRAEIELAKVINGRFVHFVHSSPLVPSFFFQPQFIALWQQIEVGGGEIGVHCHEEDLYLAWYYDNQARMEKAITRQVEKFRENGLTPRCYRGGFMTFSPKTIPILEESGVFLDFSCEPGRHLVTNGQLVSDWQGAPENLYRMAYEDHRKPGGSNIMEVPLGIYVERQSLWSIWQKARKIKRRPGKQIVSVLAHTYDFASWQMKLKIRLALLLLKRYGKFINCRQVLAEAAK
ncbi:MAG: hypothetical protein JW782_00165 [Candidatus Saganbacteria bacterium]|nr:hypothetical protein [Candidatus Saganbacteria bacterium]